jgi:hypothetical protein
MYVKARAMGPSTRSINRASAKMEMHGASGLSSASLGRSKDSRVI